MPTKIMGLPFVLPVATGSSLVYYLRIHHVHSMVCQPKVMELVATAGSQSGWVGGKRYKYQYSFKTSIRGNFVLIYYIQSIWHCQQASIAQQTSLYTNNEV